MSAIATQMETDTTQKPLARALSTDGAENSVRDVVQAAFRKKLADALTNGARGAGMISPGGSAAQGNQIVK